MQETVYISTYGTGEGLPISHRTELSGILDGPVAPKMWSRRRQSMPLPLPTDTLLIANIISGSTTKLVEGSFVALRQWMEYGITAGICAVVLSTTSLNSL